MMTGLSPCGCQRSMTRPHLVSPQPPPVAQRSALYGRPIGTPSSAQALKPAWRCRHADGSRTVISMAAKVTGMIKLALPAGKANPAPPVGPALGSKGVNIMAFCKEYNAATQDKIGTVIPVEITVFEDRSFTFILKTPPASVLLAKAAGVQKGSGSPNKEKVGKITQTQLREIAEIKLPDLNAQTIEAASRIIEGTAKNMGITIEAAAAP